MKNIPNIITLSRIILSVLLLFVLDRTVLFISIFLLCGASDVLDGYLARRMKLNGKLGAKLDSASDFILFMITVICMVILLGEDLNQFYPYFIFIIVIRFLSLITAAVKYHSFLIIHTLGNKLTGILIYAAVIFYMAIRWDGIIYAVICFAALSALEELLIHITSKHPEPDRRGLFWK
jgi:CDP-diacylglycerol--glycerol-3-phosphate 3-phosphatidyltransferase